MNSLEQLRDIHIPEGVSVFPLAYGWWIVLVLIFCSIFLFKFILWSIKTSRKYYALSILKNIKTDDSVGAAIKISELLRRICTIKYKQASALYGNEWIEFLSAHTKNKLSKDAANLLIYAPFMNKETAQYSSLVADDLKNFCYSWIGENL